MKVYDFEYDGVRLSDIGYTICSFNGKSLETISNGSQITFNTVSILGGIKNLRTSSTYGDVLTSTFDICQTLCGGVEDFEISEWDLQKFNRWLGRKQFHKFRLIGDEFVGLWWNGSFNLNRIEIEDRLVGLELELITDAPFGWMDEREINVNNTEKNGTFNFKDYSNEEGFLYPRTEITMKASGDLSIVNSAENRETVIKNCTEGEVIVMDSPVITTSNTTHEIQNDFNWNFFRVSNKVHDRDNTLTISLPCTIKINYCPVAKMGLL